LQGLAGQLSSGFPAGEGHCSGHWVSPFSSLLTHLQPSVSQRHNIGSFVEDAACRPRYTQNVASEGQVVCVIVGAVSGHAVSPWINGYGAVPPVPAAAFVPLVPPVPATAFVPLVPPVPAAALVPLVPPVPAAALVLLVPPVPATAFVLLVPPAFAPELELASPPAVPALSGVALLVPACCGLGASTAAPQPWTSHALSSNHELIAHPTRRFVMVSGQQDPDPPRASAAA
jgi:hypothetical protein